MCIWTYTQQQAAYSRIQTYTIVGFIPLGSQLVHDSSNKGGCPCHLIPAASTIAYRLSQILSTCPIILSTWPVMVPQPTPQSSVFGLRVTNMMSRLAGLEPMTWVESWSGQGGGKGGLEQSEWLLISSHRVSNLSYFCKGSVSKSPPQWTEYQH